MKIPKQLINLLGIVVLVVVLVGGIALGALPFFGNAQDSADSTRTVEQTNGIYEIQLAQLQSDAARIDEIDANLAALRSQIAAAPFLDDVQEIVIDAAEDSEAAVVSVVASDSVPWVPRTWVGETAPTGDAAPAPEPAPEEEPADADAATDTDAGTTEAEPAAPVVEEEEPAQQQIPLVIEVQVEDGAQAADFLEELGRGPRLIGIQTTTLTDDADGSKTLTVSALAFIRTDS
jgi:type II secretory pathway pseudopilin PulG